MIDPKSKLFVLHDDNSVFSDHSDNAADYVRDNFSVELVAAEDYLYLGYTKPFGSAYIELVTANVNTNSLTLEYNDGTTWQSLSLTDESKGMTRSGYWFWDKSVMKSSEVNNQEAFWVRVRPSVDHSPTSVRGINLIFSDDNMLKNEFFEIDNSNLLPPGESSHIVNHVASRNTIIQRLRNLGYIKTTSASQVLDINQWDLIDIFEIRQAATMLCLAKIFFILSDSPEDTWWAKYREYQDKYEEMFRLARLSIDIDNDGTDDAEEVKAQVKSFRWNR